MAISFVGAGAVAAGDNVTVDIPSGYQRNDLLILTVTGGTFQPNVPAAWRLVGSQTTTPRIYIFAKYAASTESSVSVTNASASGLSVILAYRGTGTLDVNPSFATATSTTIATNSITTALTNDYVVSLYSMATGVATWTAPGSTTTRVDSAGTSTLSGLLIVDELQAAAGASATRTATSSVSKALSTASFAISESGNRYWVGGAGTWNSTSKTNWSTSSGGASGAPVPSPNDSVFFDQAGTYTVSVAGTGANALTCLDFTQSAGTVTFTQTAASAFVVGGSLSLTAGTINPQNSFTFNSVTTGKTVSVGSATVASNLTFTFDGVGGGWTVNSNLANPFNLVNGTLTLGSNVTSNVTVTGGTFSTANYNMGGLTSSNTNTRSITLGSSTLTGNIDFTTSTNLTFNAGTSQINCGSTFNGGGNTFYNVSFVSISAAVNITGTNTFNNLTFQLPSGGVVTGRCMPIYFAANQTINGTLSVDLNGLTAPSYRVFLASNTPNTARTLTVATSALINTDFRDITIAGVAAPISGTSYGNCGGNSGITFTAAKTVYWNLAGTRYFIDGWATTNTGTPSENNVPLAQDTAIIDNTGAAGTIILSPWNIGTVNITRTSALTIDVQVGDFAQQEFPFTVYGDWTTGTGTTITSSNLGFGFDYIQFAGASAQTITTNGVTWGTGLGILSRNTVTLADNFTTSMAKAGAVILQEGTLNLNGKTLTLSASTTATFLIEAGTKNLTFNGGTLSIAASGTTAFNNANPTNFTTTAGTGTGTISLTSASAKTFVGGGSTYNCKINQGGAGALTITGANTFSDITNTYSATGATTITFSANQTFTTWSAIGTVGNLLTVNSNTANTARTLTITNRTTGIDYLDVRDITSNLTPVTFYAGANTRLRSNVRGVAARAPVSTEFIYVLTSGTSFTVPANWNNNNNEIHLFAGGGGGSSGRAGASSTVGGAGGGGGGYTKATNVALTPSGSVSYAIGAAGTAGTNGVSGGNTTFNSGAYTTTGGGGGQAVSTPPSSTGGTAGTGSTFNGGVGGSGATAANNTTYSGGGGGAGAGGPLGAGQNGGNGFNTATQANVSGGGGGGNGGGTAGGNASSATGGTGGNNNAGTGGGSASAGFNGGGGAGGVSTAAGFQGGSGSDIVNAGMGGGGGAGGAGDAANTTAIGGLFGGGGAGGGSGVGSAKAGSSGGQGGIIIWYSTVSPSNGNFFFLFN